MSLLSYNQIADLLEDGVVENSSYNHINSASLDLTLGRYIIKEKMQPNDLMGFQPQVISLAKREQLCHERVDLEASPDKSYILTPGEFILAQTKEIFHLPCDVSAEYKLKSSMARMGLEHLNAGWCDAGWNGSVLTLELRNLTTYHHIKLTLGDKIGQMIFFKHLPVPHEKSYAKKGSYNGDRTVQATRKEKE